jgi:hypothetical protein
MYVFLWLHIYSTNINKNKIINAFAFINREIILVLFFSYQLLKLVLLITNA